MGGIWSSYENLAKKCEEKRPLEEKLYNFPASVEGDMLVIVHVQVKNYRDVKGGFQC
jgi:hypothetical protein